MIAQPAPSTLILVVDDDTRTARRLAQMLREDGYEVEVAGDGAAAIDRLSRSPAPDALVTDLKMPHASGLAVAQFARLHRPLLPVFIVTGYPELVGSHQPIEPPAVVLTKPLVYEAFTAELAKALKR